MSKLAVCTIVTKSYLPYARTLFSSLSEHSHNVDFYVLLADRIDDYFDPSLENFKFIYLEDLPNFELIERMCFYYTPFELCCALRGVLHEYMYQQTDVEKWLFIDSDVTIHSSLDIIFDLLEASSILLTPHNVLPANNDCVDPFELRFLRTGLYNGGFIGIRRSNSSWKFIQWFRDRLQNFSFNDAHYDSEFSARGLFVDQLWLNLVPLYFDEVGLCLEPGANLGHWNIFDRKFARDSSGNITVDSKPLLFTHFSGWDINNTKLVSKYALSLNDKAPQEWTEISVLYKKNLLEHEYEKFINYPYAFNFFENGETITSSMRYKYHTCLMEERMGAEHNPFSQEVYSLLKHYTEVDRNSWYRVSLHRRVFRKIKSLINI
jgi:hypothetical protein